MSCEVINLNKEKVANILMNKGLLWEMTPDMTVEDTLARYKFLQDNMYLPEGENARYTILDTEIAKRFSSLAKEAYEKRIGKSATEKELKKPDFIKKKNVGTRIHSILAELMEVKLGKRDIGSVRSKASQGLYGVSGDNFNELVNVVNELYDEIQSIQKDINPKGKVNILIEQRTLDPVSNYGGTMDIHAIFSDNTGAIYDYKTTHSALHNYKNGVLVDELLHENKIADNELTMAEYKRTAIQRIGLKRIRHTRLVPIHVRLEQKEFSQQKDYDYYTPNVELIEAGAKRSKYLRQIPVAGEATKYEGINDLLDKQYTILLRLTKKLEESRLTTDERDRIKTKVSLLRRSIRNTIVSGEIFDIITSANKVVAELNIRLKAPKTIKDVDNPQYLDDNELKELIDEANVYSGIIENTSIYYRDWEEDPERKDDFKRLRSEISVLGSNVAMALADARMVRESRILEDIDDRFKSEKGGLLPLEELDFFEKNFTRISEIDHPIFKTAWKMIEDKLYEQREELEKISDDLNTKDAAVAQWAKDHGISKMDAFKKIIDFKSTHLIDDISQKLRDKIDSAYTNPNIEQAYDVLWENLEIIDEKKYAEDFERRYTNYSERMKHKFEGDPTGYKKALSKYYVDNNLLKSKTAWVNRHNRWNLRYKESVRKTNYSEEYKAIMNEKPLLDYYNSYRSYNNKFRNMLGITHYYKLPSNFIANVRKSMVDSLSVDSFTDSVKYISKEFWETFNVRQEDVYISDRDTSGDLKRNIPILFLNPLRNSEGEVDDTRKSYDLTKNIMLFAKMAYNFEAMNDIEPKILALREIMANPTSEQGGTAVRDSLGRKIRGKVKDFATKKGFDTDTYELFEDLTDYYLYGLKFKTDHAKVVKTIMKLKNYYSKKALSFAIIPGVGAYLAGNTAAFFEATKGISYTRANITQSLKNMATDYKKYKALSLFFDPYQEDPTTKFIENKSVNWLSRVATTRNMFFPLRKADENMTDNLLNRVALNFGINAKGELVRLNRPGADLTGVVNIWDATTLDPKTGKLTIKGITDGSKNAKENFIAFRNRVRSTSANIIGSLSQEEISRIDVNLVYNLMFQFKTWMPGVVRERTGKLIWDDNLDAVRWGRYRAAFSEYGLTSSEQEGAVKINKFIQKILLPNLGKLVLDISTFGLAPKMGMVGESFTDAYGKTFRVRSNIQRAKRLYYDWMLKNPHLQGKVTFEDFLQTKEGQTKAMIVELRTILSFIAFIAFLGGGGDDGDPPRYMSNWMTRFIYKNLAKANSELTFMWSPKQFAQLVKNPIPMTSVLTDVGKLLGNTLDEGRDVIFGENNKADKAPAFFYTIQMAYGGNQLARFFELFDTYKKSPY
jgi:hypothetical protein